MSLGQYLDGWVETLIIWFVVGNAWWLLNFVVWIIKERREHRK